MEKLRTSFAEPSRKDGYRTIPHVTCRAVPAVAYRGKSKRKPHRGR